MNTNHFLAFINPDTLAKIAADLIDGHSVSGNDIESYTFDGMNASEAYRLTLAALKNNIGDDEAGEMIEESRMTGR